MSPISNNKWLFKKTFFFIQIAGSSVTLEGLLMGFAKRTPGIANVKMDSTVTNVIKVGSQIINHCWQICSKKHSQTQYGPEESNKSVVERDETFTGRQ